MTLANYRSAVHSLRDAGIVTTRDLVRVRLAEWISAQRRKDLLPQSINTQLGGILSLASYLERSGRFPLSRLLALRRLRLRLGPSRDPVFLDRPRLARLKVASAALDPELWLGVQLAVFAGLRLSELLHLHAEDLVIEESVELPYIRALRERGEMKTKRSRCAPIARAFAAELRALKLLDGPIFTASKPSLKRWLARARDAAELHEVTWFVLRHSFASFLRQAGVELQLIAGFMGNTVRIAEKHYAALSPGGHEAIERGFADPDCERMPA